MSSTDRSKSCLSDHFNLNEEQYIFKYFYLFFVLFLLVQTLFKQIYQHFNTCEQQVQILGDQMQEFCSKNQQLFQEIRQKQVENHQQNPSSSLNKEKPIQKNRSGRPKKKREEKDLQNNQENQKEDEEQLIDEGTISTKEKNIQKFQFVFIDFFSNIKQEKGFVYGPECRKKFIKASKANKENKFKWSETATWSFQNEHHKIAKICQQYGLQKNSLLAEVMLGTSFIFGEEFTSQLYFIMIEVYRMLLANKNQIKFGNIDQKTANKQLQKELIGLAENIFRNKDGDFYFFSLDFRAEIKVCKKMPFVRPTDSSAYITLIANLRKQLQALIQQ